jgi:hypothetical protein
VVLMGVKPDEEGAVAGALVCEERLVCHQPEVRLVLTLFLLRKAVHPSVAGGGAQSLFCAVGFEDVMKEEEATGSLFRGIFGT